MDNKFENNKDSFEYSYSSIHKEEIERIRNKYIETTESDFEKLKKIDAKVFNIATFVSIFVGILGGAIFALGLILSLNFSKYILGIIIAFVGFVFMGITPILNKIVLNKLHKKYAKEIIELSDKLLGN